MKNCSDCIRSKRCKPCNITYMKDYKFKRKVKLNEIRNIPCADCGKRFPPVCMDFDHLPGFTKEFTIMTQYKNVPWKRVLEEIAKCEIVCANCHRIRTATRRG